MNSLIPEPETITLFEKAVNCKTDLSYVLKFFSFRENGKVDYFFEFRTIDPNTWSNRNTFKSFRSHKSAYSLLYALTNKLNICKEFLNHEDFPN